MTTSCGGNAIQYAELEAASIAQPSGNVLDVTVYHGACDEVLAPEVVETRTEVRLRVPLRTNDADCSDIGLVLVSTVNLQQPLGDRTVIDVEAQKPLPIR